MDQHGREAQSPWAMPWAAWKQILGRTWGETGKDNVGLIAAGVAFYGFLAIVPILAAVVLSYGLFAERATVIANVGQLATMMPADAARLIGEQLLGIVQSSDGKKGFGLVLALGLALFSARSGAGAIVTALNVAYEEEETRGFLKVNALALAITVGGVLVAVVAMVAIAAMAQLERLLPTLPDAVLVVGKAVSYALMTLVGAGGAATLYRYGPARRRARWTWLTPGSLLAALMWLLLTIGFGIYVANFGNYGATYGSLSAVVVLLTWLYLSAYILLFGAELNSEIEHQTATDTTAGTARPVGERRAWVADHVAGDGPKATVAAVPIGTPGAVSNAPADLAARSVSKVAVRLARSAAVQQVGVAPGAIALAGLALLRRGRGTPGTALLAAAGGIAWVSRARTRLRAVLFDVDGTLVDSNDFHVRAWVEAFHGLGHDIAPAQIAGQIGKGGDLLIPALLPGLSKDQRESLDTRHGKIFEARYLAQVKPFASARALLERTKRSGRTVVLASSASGAEVDHYLDLLGIRHIVSATTSSDEVSTSKPAGDIFAAALKKAGVRADEAIVVGDTPYDVAAARRCGVRTVALRSGGFADGDLRGAVRVYDDAAALLRGFARSPLG